MAVFRVAVATAVICVQIVTALNETEYQNLKVQINDAKHAREFSTLLNSIVNVNKERFDNLKKMTKLQQFPSYPPKPLLRGGESEDSSEADNDGAGPEIVAYLVLPDQDANARGLDDSSPEDDTGTHPRSKPKKINKKKWPTYKAKKNRINNRSPTQLIDEVFQVDPMVSRESKRCIKACRKVEDAICRVSQYFVCSGKLKDEFRKACKEACEKEFK